ncbi:MAG TPA: division plane positioning ATPase MipZ [Acidimicrobiia bacterium]
MGPMEYLRILRRRWWVLLVATLLGFAVAFATQPSTEVPITKAPAPIYTAYATLISDPLGRQASAFGVQWDKLSLLITKGDVPQAVERQLGTLRVPPRAQDVAAVSTGRRAGRRRGAAQSVTFPFATITARPDPSTGALVLSSISFDRLYAVQMTNLFTTELLRYLNNVGVQKYNATISGLTSLRNSLQTRVDSLNQQINANTSAPGVAALQSQRDAASKQIDSTNQSLFQTTQAGPERPNLRTLEAASPARTLVVAVPAKPPVISKDQRTLIGAAIGFLLGLAGLLVFEFLNARIRDVSGTEAAARMPLVAEIPALKMTRADRFRVLTAEDPASLMAEAYRSLRTSIIAMWQRHPNAHGSISLGNGSSSVAAGPAWRPLRTLLITSPGPAEGKSVSAVNLAATFAETGASVIVIDADFRRPQLDRYFQRQAVPNLGDLGLDMTAKDFEAVLQDTNIPGVKFAASSPPKSSPGTAMATAKAAVVIAKELADIVIIDSPPLLLANDASDLSTFADATVLLVRAGWTRHKAVAGAADLLRRLEATTVGVVLVGAEHGAHDGYYGYYGYYGYGYGYGRGESVEESLRHRLMPWRRPRPDADKSRHEVAVDATPDGGASDPGSRPAPGRTGDEPWV